MLGKQLSILGIVGLFLTNACILSVDDGEDPNAATTSGSTPVPGDSTGNNDDGGADTTAAPTPTGPGCGWAILDPQSGLAEGYACGGEGSDPSGTYGLTCDDYEVELVEGGPCGELSGIGCCSGDVVWFCIEDGPNEYLYRESCTPDEPIGSSSGSDSSDTGEESSSTGGSDETGTGSSSGGSDETGTGSTG